MGLSANLMSLGGIAVAIGMLVDGSVVMVENMGKHLTHPDAEHDTQRQSRVDSDDVDPVDAAHDRHGIALRLQEAGKEVARPIFFATAIILVVKKRQETGTPEPEEKEIASCMKKIKIKPKDRRRVKKTRRVN